MTDIESLEGTALIGYANQYLDGIVSKPYDWKKKPVKDLEKTLKELKRLRDQMQLHGFQAPYKGLEGTLLAISEIKRDYPDTYHEKTKEILQGLKEFKHEAYLKKVTLERVKTSIRAHQLALKRLEEPALNESITEHYAFGGAWALTLEKVDVYARHAYFKLADDLEKNDAEPEVIVYFTFQPGDEVLEGSEKFPLNEKAHEKLKEKYGETVKIERVQFTGTKHGLIRDKYSRTNLALAYLKNSYEKAKEKSQKELENAVNEERVKEYLDILAKYDLMSAKKEIDLDKFEDLKLELVSKGLMNLNEEVKPEILDDLFLKKSVYLKNYYLSSKTLLAFELFKHYALKTVKERDSLNAFAGATTTPSKNDLKMLECLTEKSNKTFLDLHGVPLIENAELIISEKIRLEEKTSSPFLGIGLAYKHSGLTLEKLSQLFQVDADKARLEIAGMKELELTEKQKQDLNVAKTSTAKKFLENL